MFALIAFVVLLQFCALFSLINMSSIRWIAEANKLIAEPITKPDYLGILNPSPGYTGPFTEPLCFTVIDEGLWEPGNEADPLSRYLLSHIRFFMDDQAITAKPIGGLVSQTLGAKYDDQGNYLGSFGGSIETCYDLKLTKGLHIAEVQVSSMSGKQYSYKWAFEIK